ncbi:MULTISPECIES: 16S rRNA (cytidine(1402)-2'-O)-methyltransferase [Caproicibacterium]|uniref:Ribosomal RNA small subunit methyltransferase I n=1 Tax=Caproicibacterium lactatifermentans TaxID=2666138 RepID=A0ABX6PW61_9FIRM|nr:16S rRNA (cytidine(1402)-2'-O)-methyltransferase [Caproicibacterium lactatifermentans]ARP49450.1 16S rRNA (cytidine(1402)-2'-O)-methyltransferase [Ruminococcaceae bacterium CPB6]MDD4806944.1 16S rRNA (cytidine(1402)-2'-O)-methyltransferase [Oscillospiraceae bacterium]QKO30352.1 16S rRNA (cytidine(1402)-2'-O)-methyltransferase [Caproicibacterium lactatifermentans]
MSGTLYIVGTPIGNLSDFSPRAVQVLSSVDFIAAEDTRVTLKLLTHFGIKKPLISYFEHNKWQRGGGILDRIAAGENCALVSDAGMPAISDPGELLVKQAAERGIPVAAVPGPSAVVTALAVSGLPTGRFTFEGFLSVNRKSRREHLEEVKNEHRTMVFYEAPHKLLATLQDMLAAWGDRELALARELTKVHEEVRRTTLSEAAEYYSQNPPRGEFVLVIHGAAAPEKEVLSLEDATALARTLMAEDSLSASAAAKQAAAESGRRKNEIYRVLTAKEEK